MIYGKGSPQRTLRPQRVAISAVKGLLIAVTLTALLTASCSEPVTDAANHIDVEGLASEIQTLASDEFEGRAPSSPGEERTVTYLESRFKELGLSPGNGDSYFQNVPLVAMTVQGSPPLAVRTARGTTEYAFGAQYVGWTKRVVEQINLQNSDLVFVGYGIVAPEYDWNDYAGLDVTGKTVVILVNDPGFATQDDSLFNGNAMTYYGRWTYKYEEAARQGAAAALIVHDTEPAGYPWEVVTGSWTGPQFDLVADDNNMSRVMLEGWIASEVAQDIVTADGQDLEELKERALQRGFQAMPLNARVSTTLNNTVVRSESRNVLGVIPGSDRADEYVVYMAHWDHFGRDASLEGDQIFNGALDNATGTAGLIEIAEAFASLSVPTSRSVLFLAVTAEEFGLHGSAYYARNPVYPRNKTIAAINMDGLNVHGPMNDVTVVGLGMSELDNYLEAAVSEQGRTIRADPEPEKGFYYRSDHFSFAKVGIPALYPDAGIDHIEHGEEWTLEKRDEYTANNYHKPSDEYDSSWDLTGAVEDLRLFFTVGYRIAASQDYPNWNDGTEFKAMRDRDMAEPR